MVSSLWFVLFSLVGTSFSGVVVKSTDSNSKQGKTVPEPFVISEASLDAKIKETLKTLTVGNVLKEVEQRLPNKIRAVYDSRFSRLEADATNRVDEHLKTLNLRSSEDLAAIKAILAQVLSARQVVEEKVESVRAIDSELRRNLDIQIKGFCDIFKSFIKLTENVELLYSFLYHHSSFFTYSTIGVNITQGLEEHDTHFRCTAP